MKTIEKPKMTCLQLTMAVMLNMLGSSIILMPTKLAEVGTMSILAWLVTISGATTIAYVFAKCGMFSKKSGGIGGYAAYAFGKSGSFIANFSYGVSLIIANLTIAISIVGYLMVLFEWNLTPLEMGIASIIVIWLCSLPNIRGAPALALLELRHPDSDPDPHRDRLELVLGRPLHRRLEPAEPLALRRHLRRHLHDALGLPRP